MSYSVNGSGSELNGENNPANFYVCATNKIDPNVVSLAGLGADKDCIRFKKSIPVSDTHIEEFSKQAMSLRRRATIQVTDLNLACLARESEILARHLRFRQE